MGGIVLLIPCRLIIKRAALLNVSEGETVKRNLTLSQYASKINDSG